ncbi:hypothetical protein MTO96_009930 [Rhipicephalus appendiculatus]
MNKPRIALCAVLWISISASAGAVDHLPEAASPEERRISSCDQDVLFTFTNECEKVFNDVITSSPENDTVKCSYFKTFHSCVHDALRSTRCDGNSEIMDKALANVEQHRFANRLNCDRDHIVYAPQLSDQTVCHKRSALRKFFLCGLAFHYVTEKNDSRINEDRRLLCQAVHEYQKCTSMALSSTDCFLDEALRKHVSYFSSGALEDQGVACSSEGMPKAQRSQISSSNQRLLHAQQKCVGRGVLFDFFKCGLEFNRQVKRANRGDVKFKRAYSRKKGKRSSRKRQKPIVVPRTAFRKPLANAGNRVLCDIVAKFNACTHDLETKHECTASNNGDLIHNMVFVRNALIASLGMLNCGGPGPITPSPPGPSGSTSYPTGTGTIVPPTFTTPSGLPPNCAYMEYVRRYSYCAVAFYADLEGRGITNPSQEVCKLADEFIECDRNARRDTGCGSTPTSILEDIFYFTDVLLKKYRQFCKLTTQFIKPSRQTSTQGPSWTTPSGTPETGCKQKELLRRFFACGIALQASIEMADDPCKCISEYEKCYSRAKIELGCTNDNMGANFTKYMLELTEATKKMYKVNCGKQRFHAGTALGKCDATEAMRRFFLCDLSYFRLVENAVRVGGKAFENICRHVYDVKDCLAKLEYQTGCTKSALHQHAASLLSKITSPFSRKCAESKLPLEASAQIALQRDKCDESAVLKKALVCAIGFQNFMDQKVSRRRPTKEEVCPFIKDFENCIDNASQGSTCKTDMSLSAQLVTYKRLLEEEYGVDCRTKGEMSPRFSAGSESADYFYDDLRKREQRSQRNHRERPPPPAPSGRKGDSDSYDYGDSRRRRGAARNAVPNKRDAYKGREDYDYYNDPAKAMPTPPLPPPNVEYEDEDAKEYYDFKPDTKRGDPGGDTGRGSRGRFRRGGDDLEDERPQRRPVDDGERRLKSRKNEAPQETGKEGHAYQDDEGPIRPGSSYDYGFEEGFSKKKLKRNDRSEDASFFEDDQDSERIERAPRRRNRRQDAPAVVDPSDDAEEASDEERINRRRRRWRAGPSESACGS